MGGASRSHARLYSGLAVPKKGRRLTERYTDKVTHFHAGQRSIIHIGDYIADLGRRPAKPNRANLAKAFFINNMTEKLAKQTKPAYHACYQLLAAILTAIFRKFGWKRRGSLSGIRAHGQRRWHRGAGKRGYRIAQAKALSEAAR